MKKIAFIVQQYGQELYGGAEIHCMRLAEKMTSHYDVEVLTSCSIDYLTWADHYPEGVSIINNVKVRRFKVAHERSWEKMSLLERKIRVEPKKNTLKHRLKKWFYGLVYKKAVQQDYADWITAQGPATPDLINYLTLHQQDYTSLIFFAYLYYPTAFGLQVNPKKSIFLPLAHDEWVIRIPFFKKLFHIPAFIMYNTLSEKRLVNKLFHNEAVPSDTAGAGLTIPEELNEIDVKKTMNINSDYILYLGRVDINKITHDDFNMFLRYVKESRSNIKLVLVGSSYMEVPVDDNIMYLGFVDEQVKFNLIKQSLFLFQPSRFESLSMVVLEAFAMKKPVLVHKDCEVMRDHIDISHGGYYYNDYDSFAKAVTLLSANEAENKKMGESGKAYVDKNYSWESIIDKFRDVIENRMAV